MTPPPIHQAPYVSVIIPTYKRTIELEMAIRSVMSQTYPFWEIIVMDNSTEGAWVVDSLKLQHPEYYSQIKYYQNETNVGCGDSILAGVKKATGKHIKFLMDDDIIYPWALEWMVHFMEKEPTAGLVTAPMDIMGEHGEPISPRLYGLRKESFRYRYKTKSCLVSGKDALIDFLTKEYPCAVPSGVMVRAEAMRDIKGCWDRAQFAGDLDWWMTIAHKWDFYYIDYVLSSFRYVPTCHTARLHKEGMDGNAFYDIAAKHLFGKGGDRMHLLAGEFGSIQRKAMRFASLRTLLNLKAAWRNWDWNLAKQTFATIFRRDKKVINWIQLPWLMLKRAITSGDKNPPPKYGLVY